MRPLGKYHLLVALSSLSLIGGAALVVGTRWGVGLSPDSAIYVGVARNLLKGFGFSVPSWSGEGAPLVHYPPLFPMLLAGMGLFGIDPLHGARWLNALLFGANIFLAGFCLYTSTRSFYLSVAASFLVLISFPTVLVHSMAWSEPLFIFLGILGIYFLAAHVQRPNSSVLVASSLALGFAFLARYAGVSLVAAGAAATFFLTKEGWGKRFMHTAIFALISCVPLIVWGAGNLILAGAATGRKIAYHPPGREHLESFLGTISTWLFPVRDPPFANWINIIVVAVLGLLSVIVMRRWQQGVREGPQGPKVLATLLGLFILSYGLLLLVSISFLDAPPLDNRILSPAYVALVLFFLCLVPTSVTGLGPKKLRILPLLLGMAFVLFAASQLTQSASWLGQSYEHGVGYASRRWNQSELMKYVKALDPKVPIFTNGPDIIYLLAGRPAHMFPVRIDPDTGLPNNNYAYELATMRKVLQEERGVVVYFRRVTWRWYLPAESETNEGLSLLAKTEDGAVYR